MLQDANLPHLTMLAGNHGPYQDTSELGLHTGTHCLRIYSDHYLCPTGSHAAPGTIPSAGAANTTEPAHHPGIQLGQLLGSVIT